MPDAEDSPMFRSSSQGRYEERFGNTAPQRLTPDQIIELGKSTGRQILASIEDTGFPKKGFDAETIRTTHQAMADEARLTLVEVLYPVEPAFVPEDVDDSF